MVGLIPNFEYVGNHNYASTFEDDGSLVIHLDLDKFSLRWRIVEKLELVMHVASKFQENMQFFKRLPNN